MARLKRHRPAAILRPVALPLEPRVLLSSTLSLLLPVADGDFETLNKPGSTTVTASLPSGDRTLGVGTGAPVVRLNGTTDTIPYSDSTRGSTVDVPAWSATSQGVGVAGPGNNFSGKTDNYAYVETGNSITQTLTGVSLVPGTTYVLFVQVALPSQSTFMQSAVVQLAAGGTILTPSSSSEPAPAAGAFSTFTETFDVSNAAPPGDLSIILGASEVTPTGGGEADFDNVSLTEAKTPTPSPTPTPPLPATIDPTFMNGGSSLGFTTEAIAVQTDGKVVLAGLEGGNPNGANQAVLERLNADGSVDTTFGAGGIVTDAVEANEGFYGVAIQGDGRIVASGTSNGKFLLTRYNADGAPDATFGASGRVTAGFANEGAGSTPIAYGVALEPGDQGIDVGGDAGGEFAAAGFTPSGAFDPGFNNGSPATFSGAAPTGAMSGDVLGQIRVLSDNSIVGVGASGGNVVVTHLTEGGALDTAFDAAGPTPGLVVLSDLAAPDLATGIPDTTVGLAIDAAGNLLVANHTAAGDFGTVRLKPDGTRDATFGANGLTQTDFGGADDADLVAVRADGDVLVAGTTTSAGVTQTAITAYRPDGTPDLTFGTNAREVFDTGIPAAAMPLAVPAAGVARPAAEGIGALIEKVFGAMTPDGRLLVGASENAGSRAVSSLRRLNVTSFPGLPTGTFGATLAVKAPAAVVGGAKAKASATVTVAAPAGSAINGPVTVTLYVAPQQSLTGATKIAAVTKRLKLKAGRRASVKIKLSSFPSVPDGSYVLLASVTAPDGTTTGTPGPSIQIAAPFVKAVVSNVQPLPASVAPGKRAAVSLTLQDAGNIAAAGAPALTLTAQAAGAAARTLAAAPLKVKLKPGQSKAFKVKFTVPAGLAAGSYTLTASLTVAVLGDNTAADGVAVAATPLVVQ